MSTTLVAENLVTFCPLMDSRSQGIVTWVRIIAHWPAPDLVSVSANGGEFNIMAGVI